MKRREMTTSNGAPFTRRSAKTEKSRWFKVLVLILAVIAALILTVGGLTFSQANSIMRQTPVSTEPYVSNTMPDFRIASFYSLDETIKLEGWFFPATRSARGTVIMIHPVGANRLPFDSESNYLIRSVVDSGFNFFTFDQRHSGTSGGALNTFGYSEGEDVIAAISYVKRVSGSANCVLYGVGSGTTAAITAWQLLPEKAGVLEMTEADSRVKAALEALTFDRDSVKGMVFDTPLSDSDEYIRYEIRGSELFAKQFTQHTVPFAVRMSSNLSENINLTSVISRLTIPVFIIGPKSCEGFETHNLTSVATERMRIAGKNSLLLESEATDYLGSYSHDRQSYLSALENFLRTQIP